jgi:xyloglucan-specific exo-beta-1,4-glucanase
LRGSIGLRQHETGVLGATAVGILASVSLLLGCGSSGGGAPEPILPNSSGATGSGATGSGATGSGAIDATPPAPVSGLGGSSSREELPPPIAGLSGAGGNPAGSAGAPALPPPAALPCTTASANASGYCWQTVAIGGGGFVSGIVASEREPNLLYARTDVGGAYRWNEPTESWIPLNDWVSEDEVGLLGVESLALDPNAPNRVYMLAGINYFNNGKTAVLSSDDYGASFSVHDVTAQFKAHGNGMGRQNGERLAVDPQHGEILFTGTRENGLFRSSDRGATWSSVASLAVTGTPNGNGISFVVFDPAAGELAGATRHLFVGVSRSGESNLFESEDAGATFAPVEGQPTTYVPQRAVLGDNGVLFLTYANGAGPSGTNADPMDRGEVWKLDLAGGSWTEITPLRAAQNRSFSAISVDAADPNRLLASTINTYQQQPWGYGDRIFLSSDGGTSWTDLIGAGRVEMATNGMPWIENNAIHWAGSIQIDPFNPERALLTSGNGIFMTRNLSASPATWTFAAKGVEEMVPLGASSVAGAPLASVMGDYDGFIHDDPKVSPARGRYNPGMGTTSGLAVAALDPSRLARAGSQLYVSRDAAASWTAVTRPSDATGGQLAFSADGAVLLWSVGATSFKSADLGVSWAPVRGLDVATIPEADAVNPSKFYAYDREGGALLVSGDAAASFATAAALPTGGARRIRAVPGVEGELWVALNEAGLRRSTDSGSSFSALAAVQSCRAVGFGAPRTAGSFPAVYIWGAAGGGPRGLYRSDDAGASFVRINDDAHEYGGPGNGEFVIGDANVYGRVYMSSAGRGIVLGELAPPE